MLYPVHILNYQRILADTLAVIQYIQHYKSKPRDRLFRDIDCMVHMEMVDKGFGVVLLQLFLNNINCLYLVSKNLFSY